MFYTFVPKACYVAAMIVRVWAMTMRTIWVKFKTVTSMKKNFSKVMLVAAAAMAFFACQKQEINAPEEVKVEGLNFSAEKPEFADASKTEWTGSEIHWSKRDAIRVAYTCGGVWQNADGTATASEENGKKTAKLYASAQLSAASATAKFAVPGNFKGTAEGVYEFYAVYPSGAAVKDSDFPFAPSVTVNIPAEQTPLANSFDSAADLMAAKSVETFEGLPTESISLLWTRIVAHGHLTLKNLQVEEGEKLQTITLTADEDADMVGEHYLYLDTYDVEKAAGNNAANSLTVKADNLTIAEGGNVTFWTCFLPCTWKSLDVVVETDKATYTLERNLVELNKTKTFAKNARNVLAINMASAVREVKSSNSLPFVMDFSELNGNNQTSISELEGFTSVSGYVYLASGAVRLAKSGEGGSIITKLLDLSSSFHVKVTASGWNSDELSLIVSSGDQSETVTLSAVGNGNSGPGECAEHIINFQPVSNSSSVTFEASAGKRCYIKKIEILEGHAELTPVLSATTPEEMSADGGEGSFTYTLSNPKDGKTVSATKNVDWIEDLAVNQENKTVSYSVAENTAEESRTATITLSYEGAQPVGVTVTQKGKTAEGDTTPKFVKVTAAPVDWSGVYILGYTNGSTLKTLCGKNSGGDYGAYVDLTLEDQSILSSEVPNECILTIESTTNGYSLNVNNTYLGYTSISTSGNNSLWFNSSFESEKYEWTIKMDGENVLITNVYNTGRVIKWNSASNGLRFACYTSAQSPIQLYKLMGGEPGDEEPKPSITVSSEASVNVEAAGATGTVSYTLTNAVADAKVSAAADQTWVTIGTVTSTSVPFTVSENTGGERTATITLSYDGAVSKTVNITQAAAPKPEITVSSEVSVNVEAAETTGYVSYTLANAVAGAKVSAEANQTWVTIGTVTSTSVPFTVSENTGGERTATITLSYDGAVSKTVNITQAAAQSGGGETKTYTVTYTVASTTSVTVSGDAPEGSSATFNNTYKNNKQQMTSGNSQTYTLSGYDGCAITGIKLSMKSNASGGGGSLSVKAGSKTIASIADSKFNTASWNGDWSTSFVDIKPTVTETLVEAGEDVVVVMEASANSLYCQSITITYESTGNAGGGGTVDPEPSVKTYTLTIDANSFNATSYAANNNAKTSTATATDGSTMDVKWTSNQVMKQSSAMQWQKSNGYIYNTTDLGTITDISITSSAGTFTKYIGSSQKPTASGSGGYFQIKVGGATGTASKIVITFQK